MTKTFQHLEFWRLEFVSDFGFSASDFPQCKPLHCSVTYAKLVRQKIRRFSARWMEHDRY